MRFFPSFFNKYKYKSVLEWGKEVHWGEPGSGAPGTFYFASDLAVGKDSSVYVADCRNDRIQKFDVDGNFLTAWDTVQGADEENIFWADNLTVDEDGNVYASTVRSEVMKFTPDGKLVWRKSDFNNGKDWISYARAIDVSREGIVYVYDYNNNCIVCFTSNGEYFGKFIPDCTGINYIVAGPDRSVYISSHDSANVQKYDKFGNFIALWKQFGRKNNLHGLAIDDDNNFYCIIGNSVKQYNKDGKPTATLYRSGKLNNACAIDISPDGSLFLLRYLLRSGDSSKIIKLAPVKV